PVPQRGAKQQPKKRDLAEERRLEIEQVYHEHGLKVGTVPKPELSNRAITKLRIEGKEIFAVPPEGVASYRQIMTAFGQADHWTLTHEDRHKIVWEPLAEWRWIIVEVTPDCSRRGTCWNDLNTAIYQLSLEEYAPVWHLHKALTGIILDQRTFCWLRTRYRFSESGLGALRAGGWHGEVRVRRDSS
ncbi:MAG: hypothetical protein ABH846_02975, partial [Patescibacteria group bacterium]